VTLPETVGSPHRSWRQLREQLLGSRFGGPVRVLARGGGAGVLALALAELHATDDPGVLCPLRRLTGVPCPVCGSTTVFMELGAGHPGAAIAANPVTATAPSAAGGGGNRPAAGTPSSASRPPFPGSGSCTGSVFCPADCHCVPLISLRVSEPS